MSAVTPAVTVTVTGTVTHRVQGGGRTATVDAAMLRDGVRAVLWLLLAALALLTVYLICRPPLPAPAPPLAHYLLPSNRPALLPTSCNSTLVTAYYRIPSKHSHEEYLAWMVNLLSLQDCLVVFCSPDQQETLQALRPSSYPTLILPRPISSFLMSNLLTKAEWVEQERRDGERAATPGHNSKLYRVWNEKTNMLKLAADLNPFSSSYFVWLDIGGVRHGLWNHQRLVQRRPAEPGVLLLSVEPFSTTELGRGDKADFSVVNRVGGGGIGADPVSLAAWHAAYYSMVERYRREGRFLGEDQSLMAATCLQTGLCLLVQSDIHHWFRLQNWLRGEIPANFTRQPPSHNNRI